MSRLLILCEHPTLLGGERSMLATLPAVAAAGIDVQVAAPPAGPLADALRERGVEHVAWSVLRDVDEHLLLPPTRTDLARLLGQLRPELVHANGLSIARISGPVIADASVSSLGHLRDIVRLSRQAVGDLNRHTRLIAVSCATRDFHVDQGLDADRCSVLHNGVDLDEFRPRSPTGYLHRELRLPVRARLGITIGQLGPRKGTEVVLAAAALCLKTLVGGVSDADSAQVANHLADVHWLIVGERTSNKDESRRFESNLSSLAAEPPLAGRVHFLGSRADAPQLMNECVLLIHTARQEPLGRVLLEAAASGLAVVATDVGGTREIFPSECDGAVLVPPNDDAGISRVIGELLHDEPRRLSLAAAGRRRAEQAFNIRAAAGKLVGQYRELLG
jgi:glycosyltransferase involved in cell wall biosynthesis